MSIQFMKNFNFSVITEDSGISYVKIYQVLVIRSIGDKPVVLYSFFNHNSALSRRDSLKRDFYDAFVLDELVFF